MRFFILLIFLFSLSCFGESFSIDTTGKQGYIYGPSLRSVPATITITVDPAYGSRGGLDGHGSDTNTSRTFTVTDSLYVGNRFYAINGWNDWQNKGNMVYFEVIYDNISHKDEYGHDENPCPKGCGVCMTCTPAHVGPCDECGKQIFGCEQHDCTSHKDKYGHDENPCPKGCGVCLTCTPAHVGPCDECGKQIFGCEQHDCTSHKDKYGHDENPCPKGCGVCLTCTNDHKTQCNTCGKSYYKCETHDCTKSHKDKYGHDIVSCPKGCGVCLVCVAHVQVCQTCGASIYLCSSGHTCTVDAHKNKFGHAFNPCSTCTAVCMSCYPNHNHTPGNTDINPPAPDWVPIYDDDNNFLGWDTDDDGVPDVLPGDSPVKVVKPGDPDTPTNPDTPDPVDPDDKEDKELPLPEDIDFDWPESKALKLFAEKLAVPSFITSFGDKVVVSNIGKWTIPLDLSGSPFNASDFSFEIDFAELDKYPTIAGFLRTLSIIVYALMFILGIFKALRQW